MKKKLKIVRISVRNSGEPQVNFESLTKLFGESCFG